ncbi:class II aldolase/adducin family protein [bacterium]|nr:class II aldolase/adducin family protein [bacterium]
MVVDKLKKLLKYGKIAAKRGLTPGYSGNMSIRYGDKILITATGSSNGFLDEEDISLIDFDGNNLAGNKPSSEKFLHIRFYKERPDINAVLHFHPPFLTAFAAVGVEPDKNVLPEIVYEFGHIPLAEYAIPGSIELVENTAKYFVDHDIILMKNHGVIACGKSVKDAFLKIETCESYAKMILMTKLLGSVNTLNTEEVKKIYELRQQ